MYRNNDIRRLPALLLVLVMVLTLAGCGGTGQTTAAAPEETTQAPQPEQTTAAQQTSAAESATADEPTESGYDGDDIVIPNGDIYILFTSDIHCGVDQGFGFAGLQQIRDGLEAQGYTTILVDDGDAIQGETIGTVSDGEAIIDLMNEMHYDVAIPGNHEFDYGMEQFLALAEKVDFPYISCNFNKEGELIFDPYVIIEAQGIKVAFVGVTTPKTLTSSTPAYFKDDAGSYIYGFMQDETGEAVYAAVQQAVDDARAEGADYVYVMGHIGMGPAFSPWSYSDIIEHTSGIDVFLDGHSHDTEQVVMKNRDGVDTVRSACGTKMSCIGYSHISAENGITDTGIWTWNNSISAPQLLGIQNNMSIGIEDAFDELDAQLSRVVASTSVDLTIYDPVEKDTNGSPIRMIRRAETNLGDLCADAFRAAGQADIGMVNGGGIRVSIPKGDITYGDIIKVFPFGNSLCVIEATGQQILDALEWGVHKMPGESGGFIHVSGMTYEVDMNVETTCQTDENGMMSGISGDRLIKNVTVGGEPLDPAAKYTVAGTDYTLLQNGDGQTAFDGAPLLQDRVKLDNQLLIEYIADGLGGVVGEEYADPYGQGRITITDAE